MARLCLLAVVMIHIPGMIWADCLDRCDERKKERAYRAKVRKHK